MKLLGVELKQSNVTDDTLLCANTPIGRISVEQCTGTRLFWQVEWFPSAPFPRHGLLLIARADTPEDAIAAAEKRFGEMRRAFEKAAGKL